MKYKFFLKSIFFCLCAFLIWFKVGYSDDIGYEVSSSETSYTSSEEINALEVGVNSNVSDIWGVYSDHDLITLENTESGKIEAIGEILLPSSSLFLGSIIGVSVEGDVDYFSNRGNIMSRALIGDINIDSGSVNVKDNFGVYILGEVASFYNYGYIRNISSIGDIKADQYNLVISNGYGIFLEDRVDKFYNYKDIIVESKVGNIEGSEVLLGIGYMYGVYFNGIVGSFSNYGTIRNSVEVGDITGNDSGVEISYAYGVYFNEPINNFLNTGTVKVDLLVGDAIGTNSSIVIREVEGLYINSNASLINRGNIFSLISSGKNSEVLYVGAVGMLGEAVSLINYGSIKNSLNLGKNSTVEYIYGIYVKGNGSKTIVNNGTISLLVEGEVASVDKAAAIYVEDAPNVTISSKGPIYLYSDNPNANMRTLWLTSPSVSSQVTIEDYFGIVFGSTGINKRPIYVEENSVLDLNGATLVAYAGERLKFNKPYYIIELESSSASVLNSFSGLKNGAKNPDLEVDWYALSGSIATVSPEDLAVIWKYKPEKSAAIASIHAPMLFIKNMVNSLDYHLQDKSFFSWGILEEQNIQLASSEHILGDRASFQVDRVKETQVFIEPLYSDIEADNLGYEAQSLGINIGLERQLSESLFWGGFGGISELKVTFTDWKNGGIEDKQTVYHLGNYGMYVQNNWYVKGTAIGYGVEHQYLGKTGPDLDLRETAEYWSYGVETELVGGYIKGSKKEWLIMPEVGLGFSYWKVDSFKTKASDEYWNKSYQGEDDEYVRSILGITGVKRLWAEKYTIDGLVSLRWEHTLNNSELAFTQSLNSLGSGKKRVKEEIGKDSLVGRVGLKVYLSKNSSLDFLVRSEYNQDYKIYSGNLSLIILF